MTTSSTMSAQKTRPRDGTGSCRVCKCPLLLLKLEKRRWEYRTVCARCGEAKIKDAEPGAPAVKSRPAVYTRPRQTAAAEEASLEAFFSQGGSEPIPVDPGATAPVKKKGLLIDLAMVRNRRST
jgi:hypothetical protein